MTAPNCMGYFHWTAHNCDTCVRAFRVKKGKQLPDFNATQRLVNLGRECKIKFAIEYAMGTWTDIPDEIGALMSGKNGQWADQCMMHSDEENDRPGSGPRKPRDPAGPNQLMLFSIVDEVFEEMEQLQKEYA
ncbi:MAG TPA: hypothetical protein PLZ24_15630 [Flavobacteriales bacterium]|nr:hypothetical protein [Flavobacteriales bacterium]